MKRIIFCGLLLVGACSVEDKSQSSSIAVANEVDVVPTTSYQVSVIPPNMTVQEKKQRFRELVAPALDQVYGELWQQYQDANAAVERGESSTQLDALKQAYGVQDNQALLMALKPHPKSIALAQAAMESAWGTSRFFREANNIFGVWSFDENDERIAAGKKRGDKTIWIKKYPSVKASIEDYYALLSKRKVFLEFRELRMQTDDPYLLVAKLDKYSERGSAYGEELASMIRFNKFYDADALGSCQKQTIVNRSGRL